MKKLLNLIFFVFIVFIFTSKIFASEEKIKVGLLLPLNGQNQEIGKSVLRSVNLAINKIDDPILEIYPKNNFDNPDENIKAAQEAKFSQNTYLKDMLLKTRNAKLIKHIHFNPDHQENHNVKIPNRNKNIAQIFNGTNWELANKNETLADMSDKAYNMINEHYEEGSNKYMDGFKEKVEDEDSEVLKKINKDVELTVLNCQDKIKY